MGSTGSVHHFSSQSETLRTDIEFQVPLTLSWSGRFAVLRTGHGWPIGGEGGARDHLIALPADVNFSKVYRAREDQETFATRHSGFHPLCGCGGRKKPHSTRAPYLLREEPEYPLNVCP